MRCRKSSTTRLTRLAKCTVVPVQDRLIHEGTLLCYQPFTKPVAVHVGI